VREAQHLIGNLEDLASVVRGRRRANQQILVPQPGLLELEVVFLDLGGRGKILQFDQLAIEGRDR
jgi:hypothetical protein